MPSKFDIVKKGYNPLEVDPYIETLENVVKSYKEKDNAIKNAILAAQIAADNIVSEAKEHADKIVQNSHAYLSDIKNSISEQKRLFADFQAEYNALMKKYIINVNERDFEDINNKINLLEDYFVKLAKEKEGYSA